jgi:hypothetical protein
VPEAPEPAAPEPVQQAVEPEPAAPELEPEGPGAEPEAPEPAQQQEPAPQEPAPQGPAPQESAPNEEPAPAGAQESSNPDEDLIVPELDEAEAPEGDVHAADTGTATAVDPDVAMTADIDDLREVVETQMTSTTSTTSSTSTTSWNQSVSSWNSSWLRYDTYYRPVILNPYQHPLQLVYTYDNAPRIVTVNPRQRVVLDAKKPGVYSFTALTRTDPKTVSSVSVGSFSGGGYVPAPGQPPSPKPASLQTVDNVLVQLKYAKGSSKPFRVKHLTDLGDDPAAGARRVLLDNEIPAWGQWSKTGSGERLFAISKTDLLPGLTAPSQGKLPGYDVQLVAQQSSTSHSWGIWLWVAVAAAGVVAVGAVIFAFLLVRRRRT